MVHEFGILDDIDRQKNYIDYTPQKYDCVAIDDEIISSLMEELSSMKTYFHSFDRPKQGLAYYGITIIPPETLSLFYSIITSSQFYKTSIVLKELALKIHQAREANQYMIHFGI